MIGMECNPEIDRQQFFVRDVQFYNAWLDFVARIAKTVAGEKSDTDFLQNLTEKPLDNDANTDAKSTRSWKKKIHLKLSRNARKVIKSNAKAEAQDETKLATSSTELNSSASVANGFSQDRPASDEEDVKFDPQPQTGTDMSMLHTLAFTALNLAAPASSVLLNNRRNSWIQLSGHQGCLAPAGPGTIWKKRSGDTNESVAYRGLMQDVAKDIVPTFYKEVTFQGDQFIEMRDLLYEFNNPSVMDVKIGTRTFLESEVSNKKARNDLYLKMLKVDPTAPTEEETRLEAITKLRYMDFRDNMSSSRLLGFRIDALKMSNAKEVTEVRTVRTREEVSATMSKFLGSRNSTRKQILTRLKEIKNTVEVSPFFQSHEVIGSSILIIYDDEKAGAWIIDFAKTHPLPENIKTDHRSEWCLGNHEEGYLTGLDNLIKVVEEVPHKSKKIGLFGR